jgi:hypothetical protein
LNLPENWLEPGASVAVQRVKKLDSSIDPRHNLCLLQQNEY